MELIMRKETLLNEGYLKHWTLYEAAKEFTQNYVFALQHLNTKGKTWYENGLAYWEDYGSGFDLSCLLIGVGQQKEIESAPGENSEGMKISILVAARENKYCSIEIPGYTIRSKLEEGKFEVNELVLYIYKNSREKGTKFILEVEKDIYNNAIESFGYLTVKEEDRGKFSESSIIDDGGSNLYINGVKINSSLRTIFSYNLIGKNLSNRDRNAISPEDINIKIWEQIFSKLKDVEKIKRILSNFNSNTIEFYYTYPYHIRENINLWKQALKELYGNKVCYATGDKSDNRARYRKFKIMKTPVDGALSLLNSLNVRSSAEIAPEREIKQKTLQLKDLTEQERQNIRRIRKLIQKYYCPNIWNLRYIDYLLDEYENKVSGICKYNEELIYLEKSILSDWDKLFKTLLHEVVHQMSNADDCSIEFEKEWEKASLAFAKGCIRER